MNNSIGKNLSISQNPSLAASGAGKANPEKASEKQVQDKVTLSSSGEKPVPDLRKQFQALKKKESGGNNPQPPSD
ncbi:MAG: hypothetical protein ACLFQV_02790, partial [Vulcanimicrobiota bacterium]